MRPVVLVLALVVLVPACGGDDEAVPATVGPTTTAPDGRASLYELSVGDCLDGLAAGTDLLVEVVPCDRPHQAEVYGTAEVRGEAFPGVDQLRRRAATACAQRFAGYTGEPAGPGTELAFVEVVPTVESWAAGDRAALCLALGPDGAPLSASIAG